MTFRALVLLDIDGTLVRRAGSHHRDDLVEGVRRVTELETTTAGIPVQGMLDPDILTIMLKNAGASRHYVRVCPEIQEKRCPSVIAVLDRLFRSSILLGFGDWQSDWHRLAPAAPR